MFPRSMVCLRNISVDTLHKGDTEDDDDDDNNNNNDNDRPPCYVLPLTTKYLPQNPVIEHPHLTFSP